MHTTDTARHESLVDQLVRDGTIRTPAVEAAFRAVPRHPFLPDMPPDRVYRDEAIPTKRRDGIPISSSSQPSAMAVMLEQLGVRPGNRVLEIGAGTGYNAALLAHLVGEQGEVVTVDLDADVVAEARAHLEAAGSNRVRVVHGDGGVGYPNAAPYDRIILSVGAWDIAPSWVEQLRPDGRLLLPLWVRGTQKTVAFAPAGDHLASVSVSSCAFMRLRGAFAGPEAFVRLGPEPGLTMTVEDRNRCDPDAVYALLTGPFRDHATGVVVCPREIWDSLSLWLALREPGFCSVSAEGEAIGRAPLPPLVGSSPSYRNTRGLADSASLCLLTRSADPTATRDPGAEPRPFPLSVRAFGDSDTLARGLSAQVTAWNAASRPGDDTLRIRVYPLAAGYVPAPGEIAIDKRWHRLVFTWR